MRNNNFSDRSGNLPTQRNLETLVGDGFQIAGPGAGWQVLPPRWRRANERAGGDPVSAGRGHFGLQDPLIGSVSV